jgi:uncharacterized protein YcbK (DUF882 family)
MSLFQIGEKVSLLDETGVFTIREFLSGKVIIEDEFGFERLIETRFIVKRKVIAVEEIQQKDMINAHDQSNRKRKTDALPEIDLHLENLVLNDLHMSAHEKFSLQIDQFKAFTNKMIQNKTTKFRVIHGIGEGKLKSEIRSLIESRVGFTMHDDNIVNGKVGASLIEMQVTKVIPF